MRRFLVLISLFAGLFFAGVARSESQTGAACSRFMFALDTSRGYLSGVMVMAMEPDAIKGTVVNEFGFTAVDFVYNRHNSKVKLKRVVSFLDNWKVRYMLRRDLAAAVTQLLSPGIDSGKRYDVEWRGDTLMMTNRRYGLKYSFIPMESSL